MLVRTPSSGAKAVSCDSWTCPQCSISLTIVHSRTGTHVEYDIEDWARCCHCAAHDSPLACPCVGRNAWKWLSPPAPERPAAERVTATP